MRGSGNNGSSQTNHLTLLNSVVLTLVWSPGLFASRSLLRHEQIVTGVLWQGLGTGCTIICHFCVTAGFTKLGLFLNMVYNYMSLLC